MSKGFSRLKELSLALTHREDLAARGGREQDVGVMNAPVTSRLDGHDFASSLYSLYLA